MRFCPLDGPFCMTPAPLPRDRNTCWTRTSTRSSSTPWNTGTSSYDASTVPTSLAAGNGLTLGPDGFLYTFSSAEDWQEATKGGKKIYRVDPVSGAYSEFASVAGNTFVYDWDWDSDGTLWIGLRKAGRKSVRYVAEVVPGSTVGTGNAISSSSYDPHSIAAAPQGKILVLEWIRSGNDYSGDTLHELSPSGDSGDGGGGKGGGKGKNK